MITENHVNELKPYLIQEGKQNKRIINQPINLAVKLDTAVDFSYMGSFEFENNALKRSLERMKDFHIKHNRLGYDYTTVKVNGNAKQLITILGKSEHLPNLVNLVQEMYVNKTFQYKEPIRFTKEAWSKKSDIFQPDFWWDIENDFMFFLPHQGTLAKFILAKLETNKTLS